MGSIGFPPYHEDTVRYDLDRDELADAVEDALEDLRWSYGRKSRFRFWVSFPFTFFSYGEQMTIEVEKGGRVYAHSQCSFPLQWLDWGKNSSNVNQFFRRLDEIIDG